MTRGADTERLVRAITGLRQAELVGAPEQVGDVREGLEDLVGPTVSRALAARVLGVSQTALDRHVSAGAIPVVVTPSGRREVPLSELVGLAVQVAGRSGERHALGAVLRWRAERARRRVRGSLLPPDLPGGPHERASVQALVLHRLIASELDRTLVDDARRRLARWRQGGRIDPRWAQRWEQLLAEPLPEIRQVISADTAEAADLRQSSPFAGALTSQERTRALELLGSGA